MEDKYYQVVMDGKIENLNSFDEVLEYLKKNWSKNKETSLASIRRMHGSGIVNFGIVRSLNSEKGAKICKG